MTEPLRSILIGTAGLGVAAVAALLLALARSLRASPARLGATVRLAVAATLVQAAHFAEETATGFHRRFPEALGLAPWPLGFFVPFNLFWLTVWVLAAWGLAGRRRAALFPLWFLGFACAANGIMHPWLSLRAGGYFPGLVTSPLVGLAGVWLLRRLWQVTDDRESSPGTG